MHFRNCGMRHLTKHELLKELEYATAACKRVQLTLSSFRDQLTSSNQ